MHRPRLTLLPIALLAVFGCKKTVEPTAAAITPGESKSASESVVRFIALGDTGKGNPEQVKVAQAIKAWCNDPAHGCDLVLLLGDNFYPTGVSGPDDPQWKSKFEEPYAVLDLPFWAVLGNHDYGGNGAGTEFPKGAHQIAYSKKSAKWHLPANHYVFRAGPADFFAADTNRSMFHEVNSDADSRELQDFKQWIPASKAKWKIAFGHHPYLSNGPHGNAGTYDDAPMAPFNGAGVKALLDETVCGKVDLYFSGHDHNLQWLEGTCAGTQLIVSGGGATATSVEDRNPKWFHKAGTGFFYGVIDGDRFTGTFVDSDGAVLFTRSFEKNPAAVGPKP